MSHEPYSSAPPAGAPWPPTAPQAGRNPSRLLPILGAILGLLGLVVGTAAWFRAAPSDSGAPSYSEQQVADAKTAVCEAYAKGMRSIRAVASREAESPADVLPVAVNSRIGEVGVAMYLLNALEANPAAPPDLQHLIRQLAQQYQEVALIQLADGSPTDWRSNKQAVDEVVPQIDQSCQ